MNDRTQTMIADARHSDAPLPAPESAACAREEWMHDFRNALGNILIAAGAAKGLLTDQRNAEIAIAMGHIEDGCDRCLRLLRTMPS
jgi:hypothetical protein